MIKQKHVINDFTMLQKHLPNLALATLLLHIISQWSFKKHPHPIKIYTQNLSWIPFLEDISKYVWMHESDVGAQCLCLATVDSIYSKLCCIKMACVWNEDLSATWKAYAPLRTSLRPPTWAFILNCTYTSQFLQEEYGPRGNLWARLETVFVINTHLHS